MPDSTIKAHAKAKFSELSLETIFNNVEKVKQEDHRIIYTLTDYCGSDVAQIVFLGNTEIHIEIDNFPSQKKYYQTSFPVRSSDEFIHEMSRIGLTFTLKN
jgi:hypothetical protein